MNNRACSILYGQCGHLRPGRQVAGCSITLTQSNAIPGYVAVTPHIRFHPYRTYRVDQTCLGCQEKCHPQVQEVTPQARRVVLEESVWSYMLSRGMLDAGTRRSIHRQGMETIITSPGLVALRLNGTVPVRCHGNTAD